MVLKFCIVSLQIPSCVSSIGKVETNISTVSVEFMYKPSTNLMKKNQ